MKRSMQRVALVLAPILLLSAVAAGQSGCAGDGSGGEVTITAPSSPASSIVASTTPSTATPASVTVTSLAITTTLSLGAATTTSTAVQTTVATVSPSTTLGEPPTTASTLTFVTKPTLDIKPIGDAVWFEETDPTMNWAGNWISHSYSEAHGGAYKYCAGEGSVFMAYSGTRIYLFSPVGPDYGIIKIIWQGQSERKEYLVDLYFNHFAFGAAVWGSPYQSAGDYWIRVESTATKNPQSIGFLVGLDGVKVTGGALTK